MRQLETSLGGKQLLGEGSWSVGRDHGTSLPPLITTSLDDLVGGNRVTREVLYAREERKKTQGQKMDQMAGGKQRDEEEGGLPSTKSSIRL